MRPLVPIRESEIAVTDGNFVHETWQQNWQELALLLIGSVVIVAAASPAVFFLMVGMGWLALLWLSIAAIPLLAGYSYQIGRNAVGYKPRFSDLFRGAYVYAGRSIVIGLPMGILAAMVVAMLPVLAQSPPPIIVAGLMLNCAALFVVTLLTTHALPLLALFDLPLRDAWRYSLVLVIRWPYVSFGLAALLVLLLFAMRWLGLGIGLIAPLLFVPIAVNATLMLAKRVVLAQRTSGPTSA